MDQQLIDRDPHGALVSFNLALLAGYARGSVKCASPRGHIV